VDEIDPPAEVQPCECPKIPSEPPKRDKRPCSRGKRYECCEYLIEILKKTRGFEDIEIHKPKQSTKVKTANLCCNLPIKSAVLPVMMLFLRRFLQGKQPVNQFEKQLQKYFSSLPSDQVETLVTGLKSYEKIPDSVRECAFESRFDGCDSEDVLDPNFILKVWIHEAIVLGRKILFDRVPGPGKVRKWEKFSFVGPDQHGSSSLVAPWPWICEICPRDINTEFKNTEVAEPGNVPINKFRFERWEFSRTCTPVKDPNNPSQIIFDCPFEKPPGSADVGSLGGGPCHGDMRYTYQDPNFGPVCLAIPEVSPGDTVTLKGLNFFSNDCKVILKKIDGPFQEIDPLECTVMADEETPLEREGKTVATCEVRDLIEFTIPESVKDKTNPLNFIPIPPGRYSVEVKVPNDIAFAPKPGLAPQFFMSNTVWVNMVPHHNELFRFTADSAFCNEETDGPGSDEPWFQAFTAKVLLAGSKISISGSPVQIMKAEDVDSGESISFTAPDLFNGSFEKGEICAIGVIGLEVDSEDAAEKQVKTFGDAYLQYWNQFYSQLGVSTDLGILGDLLVKGALTPKTFAIGLAALFAIALMGVLFALWAPADPIGFDFIAINAVDLYDKTDPTKPLPAEQSISFSSGELGLEIIPRASKKIQPGGTNAYYYEDHVYTSSEEDSKYTITYKAERM